MSLESGRKLGLVASLIQVILPIVAIVGGIALVMAMISSAFRGIGTGTFSPPIIGASLGFIAFIICIGVLGLIGLILFLVAMHRLSNYYNEPSIFKKVLYATILSIILGILISIYEFAFVFSSFNSFPTSTPPSFPFLTILGLLGIGVVLGIINSVLYMQAFNKLAEKSGVDNFKTAGLLYLIGTLLTIMLIGGLIVWIAWIFAAMGFNKLRSSSITPPPSYPNAPLISIISQTKRCPKCGTENSLDALYCKLCGSPL
ncbi:MAG: DUF996 domain-containing protein [Bacillota bacterium]